MTGNISYFVARELGPGGLTHAVLVAAWLQEDSYSPLVTDERFTTACGQHTTVRIMSEGDPDCMVCAAESAPWPRMTVVLP